MQHDLIHIALALSAALLTIIFMPPFIGCLRWLNILETPNWRSSHSKPLPTGGGWIILVVSLCGWHLTQTQLDTTSTILIGSALGLATVSWIDDLRSLNPLPRLVAQMLAVAAGISQIPTGTYVFWEGLPVWLDLGLAGIAWLWFINLFNFMDGIDGIASSETFAICLGFILVAQFVALPGDLVILSSLIAGSVLGFLAYNWHPSKIILGDVGAIPLGYLTGWLMIQLALTNHLAAALILPLYYLADATITLIKRILRGEKFWQPHRQHFYQLPILTGLPHSTVVFKIILTNAVLIAAALLSVASPWPAMLLALVVVVVLLFHLMHLVQQDDET